MRTYFFVVSQKDKLKTQNISSSGFCRCVLHFMGFSQEAGMQVGMERWAYVHFIPLKRERTQETLPDFSTSPNTLSTKLFFPEPHNQ